MDLFLILSCLESQGWKGCFDCVAGPQRRQWNQQKMLQGFISDPGLIGALEVGPQISSGPNHTPPPTTSREQLQPLPGLPRDIAQVFAPILCSPQSTQTPLPINEFISEITPGTHWERTLVSPPTHTFLCAVLKHD